MITKCSATFLWFTVYMNEGALSDCCVDILLFMNTVEQNANINQGIHKSKYATARHQGRTLLDTFVTKQQ